MVTLSPYSSLDRRITFFVNKPKHEEAVMPIAEVAREKGYEVTFTENLASDAEIGFYLDHVHKINTINSTLSVIMLHGIDDAYKSVHWLQEPWYRFDMGLLHGEQAVENWRTQSWHPKTRPKLGVFCVGWPKFDSVFSSDNESNTNDHREQLGIDGGTTVIYAPYGESDKKLADFLSKARGVIPNVLIRHAPRDDVDYSRPFYQDILSHDSVHVLDETWDFVECLRISDILVSDGSSVIQEAILTDTVPISIAEWRSYSAERLPEYCLETSSTELESLLIDIRDNLSVYRQTLQKQQKDHYVNLGNSAESVVDLLDALIDGDEPPIKPIPHETTITRKMYSHAISMPYQRFRDQLVFSLSSETKAKLREWNVDRPLRYIDNAINVKK